MLHKHDHNDQSDHNDTIFFISLINVVGTCFCLIMPGPQLLLCYLKCHLLINLLMLRFTIGRSHKHKGLLCTNTIFDTPVFIDIILQIQGEADSKEALSCLSVP